MAEPATKEPPGYRLENYNSPTPGTLQGATVINAVQAMELHNRSEAVFIDVFPSDIRPDALGDDEIWLPKPRFNIPGSVWLANTGYGVLPYKQERHFRNSLAALAGGDPDAVLVFYCNADCWMSWNAAKRALEFGYSRVYWFPGGVDEWSEQGFELARSEPSE